MTIEQKLLQNFINKKKYEYQGKLEKELGNMIMSAKAKQVCFEMLTEAYSLGIDDVVKFLKGRDEK